MSILEPLQKERALSILISASGESRKAQQIFLRGVMSLLQRRILDSHEPNYIIEVLLQEGLLVSDDDCLVVTEEGKEAEKNLTLFDTQLIQGLFQKFSSIPHTEWRQRQKLVKKWLRSVEKNVKYSSQRCNESDASQLLSNAVALSVTGTVRVLSVTSKRYSQKSDFSAKAELANNVQRQLRECKCLSIPRKNSVQIVILDGEPNLESIRESTGFEIREDSADIKFNKLHLTAQIRVLTNIFREVLTSNGFYRRKRRFYDLSKDRKVNTPSGKVTIFDGLEISFQSAKNSVFMFIDPCSTYFRRLSDNILEMNQSHNVLRETLEGREVETLPRRSKGTIHKLVFTQEERRSKYNLKQHWKREYDITLRNELPIAEVDFGDGKPWPYPCEVIALSAKEQKTLFGSIAKPKQFTISPYQRVKRMNNFLQKISVFSFRIGRISVRLTRGLLTYDDLKELGWCQKVITIDPPSLTFSRDLLKIATNPLAVFNKGPLSKANSKIYKMLVPHDYQKVSVDTALERLQKTYIDLGFGKLTISEQPIIRFPKTLFDQPREVQTDKLTNILSNVPPSEQTPTVSMILSIAPDSKDNPFHDSVKVIICEVLGGPDQVVREETFTELQKEEEKVSKVLVLQLLIKSLSGRNGEVPWILSMPSDEVDETVYIGFGFSMEPLTGRRSSAFFAACDPYGITVVQKSKAMPYHGRYINEAWLTDIFSEIGKLLKEIKIPHFGRLLLFRSRHLTEYEREALLEYRERCSQVKLWSGIDIDVVTVESPPIRLYRIGPRIQNPSPGICVIKDEQTAFLCLTDVRQGTVQPVRLILETLSPRSIQQISQEYYDRTRLNWMAPGQTGSIPVELRIANNLARISKYTSSQFNYIFV